MIKPLISILEHLRKRCGLIDLGVVKGTKVPVDELKLPIRHELDDRVLRAYLGIVELRELYPTWVEWVE